MSATLIKTKGWGDLVAGPEQPSADSELKDHNKKTVFLVFPLFPAPPLGRSASVSTQYSFTCSPKFFD